MHPAADTGAADVRATSRPLRGDLLESIARVEAPSGFLSVYTGADPAEPDRARIELKNQCARIEEAYDGSESAEQLHEAMERLHAGVQDALRGTFSVAGFIPVGGPASDVIWVDLPGSVQTCVTRDPSPDTVPLLALIERFGESGVVTVARDQVAVYQSSRGALVVLARETVEVDTDAWRHSDGPANALAAGGAGGGGVGAMSTVGSGDSYERNLDNAAVAALAGLAAPLVGRLVADRRWERLVWFGDIAIVKAIRAGLHQDDVVHIDADASQLLDEARDALARRVDRACDEQWTQDSEVLLRKLRERRPVDRVESVDEARTLAREGRVADLAVMVPDSHDAVHRSDINALLAEVLRHGGHVRAVHAPDAAAVSITAGLRW